MAIVVVLFQKVDRSAMANAFADATLWGILLSVVFVILGVVIFQALEIYSSMRPGFRIPIIDLCKINFALMFYVLFLPSGVTFLVRWDKYRRAGYGGFDSAALVGFHKALQLFVALAVCVVAVQVIDSQLSPFIDDLIIGALVSFLFLSGFLYFVLSSVGGRFANRCISSAICTRLLAQSNILVRLVDRMIRVIGKTRAAFMSFGNLSHRAMIAVIACAIIQHFFIVLSSWAVVHMVVPEVSLAAVAFVRSITVILLMVPISVGGLGVRELVFFALFPLFGVSAEAALTSSLILFGVQLIVSAVGALIELDSWLRPRAPV